MRTRRLLLAALLAGAHGLMAQESTPLTLTRLAGPIRLDGIPDDAAWQAVAPLPLTMYAPVFRGTPTESSEIRIAYDGAYLYAAGTFHEAPGQIAANSLYRDRYSGDDSFALYLDTYDDDENGVWFYTNPAGTRMDASVSAYGQTTDQSWNAVWDVATRTTADGWSVEMRIPFSSLRFTQRDGRVVMGLLVTRLRARANERVTFPAVDPRFTFRQPSLWQEVELRDIEPTRPVYASPYVLGGLDRRAALPAGGATWGSDLSSVQEVGGDIRYALTDHLNLDASVNTDFAQVEADDPQVNLTRFPLFFPEKRQFFQERAGTFAFDFNNGGRLFNSRRIGLTDAGEPIRILGGARIVGRLAGWDVGALDMQTAREDTIPTENLGILRLRHPILDGGSYAGGILTSRRDGAGHTNTAAGLDAVVHVFGNDYFTMRGASVFDNAAPATRLLDRSQVYARYERRGVNELTYSAEYNRAGAAYDPGLGFLPRPDFTRGQLYVQYNHLLDSSRTFRSHGPGAILFGWFRNSDHRLETMYGAYWWLYEFRNGANGFFEVIHNYEDVPAAFALGNGVTVPAGIHRFVTFWYQHETAPGKRLRALFDSRVGGFYDGERGQFLVQPTWNVSRHLEVSGSYQLNLIRFPDRGQHLDVHVGQLRLGAAANTKLSAVTILQYNSLAGRMGVNLRLRYNVREGRDVWLVWDEGINTDRTPLNVGEPRLPISEARALRLKVTWQTVL